MNIYELLLKLKNNRQLGDREKTVLNTTQRIEVHEDGTVEFIGRADNRFITNAEGVIIG